MAAMFADAGAGAAAGVGAAADAESADIFVSQRLERVEVGLIHCVS
jgi:hypothetical protein